MKRGTPIQGSFEVGSPSTSLKAGGWSRPRAFLRQTVALILLTLAATGCGTKAGEWLGLSEEKALFDLQSADAGLAVTTSSNPASRLSWVCVPRTIQAGSAFSWTECESLQVQILDSRGARVVGAYTGGNDSGLTVSLSVVSGTGSLQIDEGASGFTAAESGAISTSASSGLANFSTAGLNMTSAGVKIIRATVTTSAGVTLSVSSPRFTVLPKDEVASLAFITQPQSSYLSGIGWSKVPVVEVRDEYGNVISSGTKSSVSASFQIVDHPGALRGTTTITAARGLIRPRANSMNVLALGEQYVLRATVTSGEASFTADSSPFAVVHGGGVQLAFSQQPVGGSADDELSTKPILEIRDRFGNLVTTGDDSTAQVVLKAATRSGTLTGSGVASGAITLTAVGGVADFSEYVLFIRGSGVNKRLEAIARTFGGGRSASPRRALSDAFSITAGDASPEQSSLRVSSSLRAKADGVSFVTVTLLVKDAWGNLVTSYPSDGLVEFAASGSGNVWTQPTAKSNSRGVVTGQLRATFFGPRTITVASPSGLASVASVETSFQSTVPAPTNLAYSQPNATYTLGQAITQNIPSSTGGAVASYTISGELPSGLSFSSSTGRISGTPTVTLTATPFTVTANNSGGSTTATLTLSVVSAPPTLSYSSSSFTLTRNTSYTLSATSTNAAGFSAGSLPSGLSLNSSTGAISGAPSAISVATPYTVTVTGTSGQSATATITLTVNDIPPSALAYSSASATYTVSSAITNNSPTSSGGPVVSYSITPNLNSQTGLSFSTSTGVISGTPTTTKNPAGVYTVTATNTGGSTTGTVTITVNAPAPTISYAGSPYQAIQNSAYTITPTTANVSSVSITRSLPTGLALNTTSGVISGTPSVTSSASSYTVVARNTTGQTASVTLSLAVVIPAPSNLVYSVPNATYTMGQAISSNTVSSVNGTVTSYSASLPPGLSIHPTTGAISGTPSAVGSGNYTVQASNSTGSTSATISIAVLKPGCTDSSAMNYDQSAGVSDGSCIYGVGKLPMVSVGPNNTCVISKQGVLSCFGNLASLFGSGPGYKQVSVGDHHACAITVAGALECWGSNIYGEVFSDSSQEYAVVSTSNYGTCTVTVAGEMSCSGQNAYGEGVSGSGYSTVSRGPFNTCAIDPSGNVACWGHSGYSQNMTGSGYASVSAGLYHTCGITQGGYLTCQGNSSYGETTLTGGFGYAQVSAGEYITCAIDTSGNLNCVGINDHYQRASGSGYRQVSTYSSHTCAVRTDDTIDCWGAYAEGQLGSYDRNRYGCTNSNAPNYDWNAQIDDGSCVGWCGDGSCSEGEDCSSCSSDCGSCPYCGDSSCNGDETYETCSMDCQIIPTEATSLSWVEGSETASTGFVTLNAQWTPGTALSQTIEFFNDSGCSSWPISSVPLGASDSSYSGFGQNPANYSSFRIVSTGSSGSTTSSCSPAHFLRYPSCGDGYCSSGFEDCSSCSTDCGSCGGGYCGDWSCNNGEDCSSCPNDCGSCSTGYCGDWSCNNGEDCSTCSNDCGSCTPSDCGDADDSGYDDCSGNYVCTGYDNTGDGCDCYGNCSSN